MKKSGKYVRTIRSVAGVLAFTTTVAQASIQVEEVSVAPLVSGLDGTLTFDIPQFNSNLGTLNSVKVTLTPTFGAFGSAAFNISGSTLAAVGFTVGDISGSLTLGTTPLASYGTTPYDQTVISPTYLAAPGITDGPALPFDFISTSSSAVLGTAGFTGSGFNDLVVTGSDPTVSGGGGFPLFAGFYGNVGGNMEVDYNYTPVPETSTIFAGAMLLLLAGASTQRMRHKNHAV